MSTTTASRPSTFSLVQQIKSQDQDFEWYPTTSEQLEVIKKDIEERLYLNCPSILDCGAGDGRALMELTTGSRYAIEKSRPLLDVMDPSIFVVGTEFRDQTLLDKDVDLVFCNPPYSEFSQWVVKIIKEANCGCAYFVIPKRWEDDQEIKKAVALREAKTRVLGQFDFLNAERQARATVQIVCVELSDRHSRRSRGSCRVDPFSLWFDENFMLDINKSESRSYDFASSQEKDLKEHLKTEVIQGSDMVAVLEQLYQRDINKLLKNYKALEDIDPELLRELSVNIDGIKEAVQMKIKGLKNLYWKELFNNLSKITDRLISCNRQRMLDKLTQFTQVDFSVSNAYAVLIWVLKNANQYLDDQVITVVEKMTEHANVQLYKSNEKTFGAEQWRYCRTPENLDRYSLDYRVVMARVGGLSVSSYSWENKRHNGLTSGAYDFINDLLTVANNIGFDTTKTAGAGSYLWESNSAVKFDFYDHVTGKQIELMQIRAFKKGNLHIKFNQSFMCRLNVEFGRLKGWLKTAKNAVQEMDVTLDVAESCFHSNLKLEINNLPLLSNKMAA